MKAYLTELTSLVSQPVLIVYVSVSFLMLGLTKKFQVAETVIELILVLMMYVLTLTEGAIQVFLHNITMLCSIILLSNSNPFVTVLHKMPVPNFAVRRYWYSQGSTSLRAKHSTSLVKMTPLNRIFRLASQTSHKVVKPPLFTWYFFNNPVSVHNIMILQKGTL